MIGAQLQKAIVDKLKEAPTVAGGRIYDSVPKDTSFPYITIGEDQVLDDGDACSESWEVFTDVHVWSRDVGYPEAKTLAASVVSRLLAVNSVTGFDVLFVQLENQRTLRESDGLTSRVVASFRFLVSPI